MARVTRLHVNGREMRIDVDEEKSLLAVLRDDLDLTGSKYGCGEGKCGACMVLIDGEATPSCQTNVGEAAGKQIVTIEGLARDGQLHPLQEAFLEEGAMQCGYCTPGMIVSGAALLAKNPNPSEDEIRVSMDRNVCRCGTYPRIVRALQRASASRHGASAAGGAR